MCLISNTNIPKIAQEDIVCYKVLIKPSILKSLFGKGYVTPWYDKKVKPKGLFKAEGMKEIIRDYYASIHPTKLYCIGGGFIHTYTNLNAIGITGPDFVRQRVFECIIPKGTEYFISIDDQEYASDCIIFKREIKCPKIIR